MELHFHQKHYEFVKWGFTNDIFIINNISQSAVLYHILKFWICEFVRGNFMTNLGLPMFNKDLEMCKYFLHVQKILRILSYECKSCHIKTLPKSIQSESVHWLANHITAHQPSNQRKTQNSVVVALCTLSGVSLFRVCSLAAFVS